MIFTKVIHFLTVTSLYLEHWQFHVIVMKMSAFLQLWKPRCTRRSSGKWGGSTSCTYRSKTGSNGGQMLDANAALWRFHLGRFPNTTLKTQKRTKLANYQSNKIIWGNAVVLSSILVYTMSYLLIIPTFPIFKFIMHHFAIHRKRAYIAVQL